MSIISNCNESAITHAASSLVNGNLVSFPTETVYGLGANATNIDAISRIYAVKGRPLGHPLIVHISSIELLSEWAREIPEYAIKLAKSFWPGPMTLILPRTSLAQNFITGSQDNVGIRVPNHPIALKLLKKFEFLGGKGIAAPSANRFGAVSPTSALDVQSELGHFLAKNDLILDGGNCQVGIESTIIDCTKKIPFILRPGVITSDLVQEKTEVKMGTNFQESFEPNVRIPGNFDSHYSPKAQVILHGQPKSGDGYIALSKIITPKGTIRLASPRDNNEFAREIYRALRMADKKGLSRVFVVSPNMDGIGLAINDRLKKSARHSPGIII
jgi:L-threonylcarbamoyladenylate synthase